MFTIFNKWLNHSIYFRYGFITIFIVCLFTNVFLHEGNSNFHIFYILCVAFLGIGFSDLPFWVIAIVTFFIVVCRLFLIPDISLNFATVFTYFFTYLLIAFISVGLMKYVQKVKKDNLELTTALANALDSRDPYTLHHSENVAKYSVMIAEKMKMSKETCDIIHIGALLHDIGKIGIPEHVLNKPGKLTAAEYDIIKSHTTVGHKIIKHVEDFKTHGISNIVLYHHERYDGNGYPTGLKGDTIPIEAQIVTVADAFDAITSKRVYKNGQDIESAINEIRINRGTQFHPEVADALLSLFDSNELNIEKLLLS